MCDSKLPLNVHIQVGPEAARNPSPRCRGFSRCCQFSQGPKSRSVIVTIIIIFTSFLCTNIGVPEFVSRQTDELDKYLSQAIEKVRDPIAWWWDHHKVYPRLSAMALDYLSIPGTCHSISMQLL